MTTEQLKQGNALTEEIESLKELEATYQKLLTEGLRKDYQSLSRNSTEHRILCSENHSKEMNKEILDELNRFLRVTLFAIQAKIQSKQTELDKL
jgi:hypothetical protein